MSTTCARCVIYIFRLHTYLLQRTSKKGSHRHPIRLSPSRHKTSQSFGLNDTAMQIYRISQQQIEQCTQSPMDILTLWAWESFERKVILNTPIVILHLNILTSRLIKALRHSCLLVVGLIVSPNSIQQLHARDLTSRLHTSLENLCGKFCIWTLCFWWEFVFHPLTQGKAEILGMNGTQR